MRIALITCYLLLITSALALTDSWSVDVKQHTAVQRTYKQGEAWTMQVTLRDGIKPLNLTGATASFCWYTNATDNVWWTNSASVTGSTVTRQWTPAMDVGASVYYYWFGIWQAGSTSPLWRVNGTIRLLPSPGFTPNALPVPVRTLDFADIQLTNAPWAGTNALASALQEQAGTNALFTAWFSSIFSLTSRWETAYGWGDWHSSVSSNAAAISAESLARAAADSVLSNSVASIGSFITTNRPTELYGTGFVFKLQGGTGTLWSVPIAGTNFIVTLSEDFFETNGGTRPAWTNHVFPFTDGAWSGVDFGNYLAIIYNGSTWWMGGDSIVYPYNVNSGGPDAQGSAWISIASFVYGTNQTFVKSFAFADDIPTNTLTLAQLEEWWDFKQAEISNSYYTKTQTTEQINIAVAPKLNTASGTASNLSVQGWIQLPQSAATNLVLRLVCSNEHIIVEEVYQ